MASRKDLMRIVRRDEGFSATLGFGNAEDHTPSSVERGNAGKADAQADLSVPTAEQEPEPGSEEPDGAVGTGGGKRGVVIYVAVSLTAAQAVRAERWAAAASCPVHLLMRRTAQAMRKDLFELWALSGVDKVEELRGARGRHPTSITLTLRPDLAAAFSAQLDPLAVIGLGRAISPAFRMRFEAAFDAAAEKAGF